jgi:hypothetical protein
MASPLDLLRSLHLPPQDYVIFGSAPLYAHGLVPRIEHDVDVVAVRSAWERVCSMGTVETGSHGDRVVRLFGGVVEIYDGWAAGGVVLDVEALISSAEIFDVFDSQINRPDHPERSDIAGLPFARLEDVLAFKKRMYRPKDVPHIALIEEYLRRQALL